MTKQIVVETVEQQGGGYVAYVSDQDGKVQLHGAVGHSGPGEGVVGAFRALALLLSNQIDSLLVPTEPPPKPKGD